MGVEQYKIDQISVFIENKMGRFYNVARVLKEADVNIRAMSLADTVDFGILRFVVDKPDIAYEALKRNRLIVKRNHVIAISIPDDVGGLSDLLEYITERSFNIEYMYTFVNAFKGEAVMIFKFEDIDKAIGVMLKDGKNVLTMNYFTGV